MRITLPPAHPCENLSANGLKQNEIKKIKQKEIFILLNKTDWNKTENEAGKK
jgi:hypothetical protein